VSDSLESDPKLLFNILPRVDWTALGTTASEVFLHPSVQVPNSKPLKLGFPALPPTAPTQEELEADPKLYKDLHTLLLETHISEGSLVCANCGHSYKIKEGIANFLLPNHLV
jgi:multifunctional methyltransferase subunit TRM112